MSVATVDPFIAMEWGFRHAEKGHNLDHARIEFGKFFEAKPAAALVVHDKPSALDHDLAALRGEYLCEGCGKVLMYPAGDPQLCGACEEKLDEVIE